MVWFSLLLGSSLMALTHGYTPSYLSVLTGENGFYANNGNKFEMFGFGSSGSGDWLVASNYNRDLVFVEWDGTDYNRNSIQQFDKIAGPVGLGSHLDTTMHGDWMFASGWSNSVTLSFNLQGGVWTQGPTIPFGKSLTRVVGVQFEGSVVKISEDGQSLFILGSSSYQIYRFNAGAWTQFGNTVSLGFSAITGAIAGDGSRVGFCSKDVELCKVFDVATETEIFSVDKPSMGAPYDSSNSKFGGSIGFDTDGQVMVITQNWFQEKTDHMHVFHENGSTYNKVHTLDAHHVNINVQNSNVRKIVYEPTSKFWVASDTNYGSGSRGALRMFRLNPTGGQYSQELVVDPTTFPQLNTYVKANADFGSRVWFDNGRMVVAANYADNPSDPSLTSNDGAIVSFTLDATAYPTKAPTSLIPPTQSPTRTPKIPDTDVCDSPTVDCNPIGGEEFDFQQFSIVDYTPQAPTVVKGVSYDFVLRYNRELDFTLHNDFQICAYDTTSLMDCSNTKLWVLGTEAGSTVVTNSADGRKCCKFNTYGIFNREELLKANTGMFFLMDGIVSNGAPKLVIERLNDLVVPDDISKLFAFHLKNTSVTIVGDDAVIVLEVEDVDHSGNTDFDHTGCDTEAQTMDTIQLDGCVLNLDSNLGGGRYQYKMPSANYELCAGSKYVDNGFTTYDTAVTLPSTVGSCHYFQPGNDYQPLSIKIQETSVTDLVFNTINIGVEVTNIATERCLPYESYVLAHSRLVYTLVYTINGTDVDFSGTPYLNSPTNPLNTVSKSCVGDKCTFVLKSSSCERIYTDITDTGCVFDRNDEYKLYDISVNEVGNPFSPSAPLPHNIPEFDTDTELVIFPLADCFTPDYLTFVNVTDAFDFELKAKNILGGLIDWTAPMDTLDFFREIVLRLIITDAGAFSTSDLQIEKVQFTISSGSVVLSKLQFDRGDKAALMQFVDTEYFSDGHFCRFYDAGSKTCSAFYDTSSSRTNSYVASTLVNRLDDICQKNVDETNMDFFSLLFPTWLGRINTKGLNIAARVTATLRDCTTITARRLGAVRHSGEAPVEVKYLETGYDTVLNFEGLPGETQAPAPATQETVEGILNSSNALVGLVSFIVVLVVILMGLVVKKVFF